MQNVAGSSKSQLSISDEWTLYTCLSVFYQKLRDAQPNYLDEDVVHPAALLVGPPSALGQIPVVVSPSHHPSSSDSVGADAGARSPQYATISPFPTAPPSTASSSSSATVLSTPSQLLTLVEQFDALQLVRAKRAVTDCLRIIKRAYLLMYPIAATTTSSSSSNSSGSLRDKSMSPTKAASASFPSAASAAASGGRPSRSGGGSNAPGPSQEPIVSTRCLMKLDAAVQSLLVYANDSDVLRLTLDFDSAMVELLLKITLLGRACEILNAVPAASLLSHSSAAGSLASAFIMRHAVGPTIDHAAATSFIFQQSCRGPTPTWRSLGEINLLETYLREHSVVGNISRLMTDLYTLELLVDAALPPAVCSSRLEGLHSVLRGKRQYLVNEMSMSRLFLPTVLKDASLQSVRLLLSMGLHGLPKDRKKLFDRAVSEGGLMPKLLACSTDIQSRLMMEVTMLRRQSSSVTEERRSENALTASRGSLFEQQSLQESLQTLLDVLVCLTVSDMEAHDVERGEYVMPAVPATSSTSTNPNANPRDAHKAVRCTAWTSELDSLRTVLSNLLMSLNLLARLRFRTLSPFPSPLQTTPTSDPSSSSSSWSSAFASSSSKINQLLIQLSLHSLSILETVVIPTMDSAFEHVLWCCTTDLLPAIFEMVRSTHPPASLQGLELEMSFCSRLVSQSKVHSASSSSSSSVSKESVQVIANWFSTTLCDALFPSLCVPRTHNNPQNEVGGGRVRRSTASAQGSFVANTATTLKMQLRSTPSASQLRSVIPYFTFARRVLTETSWAEKEATDLFYDRLTLLAGAIEELRQVGGPAARRVDNSCLRGAAASFVAARPHPDSLQDSLHNAEKEEDKPSKSSGEEEEGEQRFDSSGAALPSSTAPILLPFSVPPSAPTPQPKHSVESDDATPPSSKRRPSRSPRASRSPPSPDEDFLLSTFFLIPSPPPTTAAELSEGGPGARVAVSLANAFLNASQEDARSGKDDPQVSSNNSKDSKLSPHSLSKTTNNVTHRLQHNQPKALGSKTIEGSSSLSISSAVMGKSSFRKTTAKTELSEQQKQQSQKKSSLASTNPPVSSSSSRNTQLEQTKVNSIAKPRPNTAASSRHASETPPREAATAATPDYASNVISTPRTSSTEVFSSSGSSPVTTPSPFSNGILIPSPSPSHHSFASTRKRNAAAPSPPGRLPPTPSSSLSVSPPPKRTSKRLRNEHRGDDDDVTIASLFSSPTIIASPEERRPKQRARTERSDRSGTQPSRNGQVTTKPVAEAKKSIPHTDEEEGESGRSPSVVVRRTAVHREQRRIM